MTRRYPRNFPLKRSGFKKLAEDCKNILRVLEENGPCGNRKLREKTNIHRGTIDRRLSFLKDLGLVVRENRKWTLIAHRKTYKNIEEYKIQLGHGKELIKGIFAINEYLPQFLPVHDFPMSDLLIGERKKLKLGVRPEMWPYALQHLQTGYPTVFKLFEQCVTVLEKLGDKVGTGGIHENSMGPQLDLEEEQIRKLEIEAFEIRNALEEQLIELILKVVNREPFKGSCALCPKVEIG